MNKTELAAYFDHTLLKPTATLGQIEALCDEAVTHSFKGVCVNSNWLPTVVKRVSGTVVLPVAVVGFPLGAMSREALVQETKYCVDVGAKEVDMVINVGRFLDGDEEWTRSNIGAVVEAASSKAIVKVILETGYLTPEQIANATKISVAAGADFVKTSTGFGPRGASCDDVKVMRQTLESLGVIDKVGIKASGGIRDLAFTTDLIRAGATRIGASASVAIVGEL